MTTASKIMLTCPEHGEYQANAFWFGTKRIVTSCPKCADTVEEPQRTPRVCKKVKGLPKRFMDATFQGYEASGKDQEKALRYSKAYADSEKVITRGTRMLFCGKPGTGKTHLAAAISRRMGERGVECVFSHVYDIMSDIKATFSTGKSEKAAKRKYIDAGFLVIDEIGVQKGSDFERNILFEILNERHNEMRPTLVISNLGLAPLTDYLGEPFIDRIYEDGGQVVAFDWASHRRESQIQLVKRSF